MARMLVRISPFATCILLSVLSSLAMLNIKHTLRFRKPSIYEDTTSEIEGFPDAVARSQGTLPLPPLRKPYVVLARSFWAYEYDFCGSSCALLTPCMSTLSQLENHYLDNIQTWSTNIPLHNEANNVIVNLGMELTLHEYVCTLWNDLLLSKKGIELCHDTGKNADKSRHWEMRSNWTNLSYAAAVPSLTPFDAAWMFARTSFVSAAVPTSPSLLLSSNNSLQVSCSPSMSSMTSSSVVSTLWELLRTRQIPIAFATSSTVFVSILQQSIAS